MTPAAAARSQERGEETRRGKRAALDRARATPRYALGREPDQHGAAVRGALGADQGARTGRCVSQLTPLSDWPMRLWNFDKHYQFIGGSGGAGVGYSAPAAVGAALANRRHGRLSVNIQTDGDLMYAPGVLWTAAHHRIPLLSVMHNNRAYHQEVMHLQRMANRHNRGIDRARIGTTIDRSEHRLREARAEHGRVRGGPDRGSGGTRRRRSRARLRW